MPYAMTLKQQQAHMLHRNSATHTLLVGGTRSGKTYQNLRDLVARGVLVESEGVVFRKCFNHVKMSIWYDTLPKVMGECFAGLDYKLNNTDFFMTLRHNNSRVWFGGLDDKERTEKIMGRQFATAFLDECSQIGFDSVQKVWTRMASKTALKPKVYYGCNPPSMSHWTYRLFVEKVDPESRKPRTDGDDFQYLLMNPADNIDNLDPNYLKLLSSMSERDQARYLRGEFSSDVQGALFTLPMLDAARGTDAFAAMRQTVVAVDPAVTSKPDSDLTGIIVASSDGKRANVLADYSLRASPDTWVQTILNVYDKYKANYIVVETNQGGDLIESLIKTKNRNVFIRKVHAKVGKFARAEPIVALYEQGRVHHARGLEHLEREMMEYVPMQSQKSPDRLDALVYALTSLVLNAQSFEAFVL